MYIFVCISQNSIISLSLSSLSFFPSVSMSVSPFTLKLFVYLSISIYLSIYISTNIYEPSIYVSFKKYGSTYTFISHNSYFASQSTINYIWINNYLIEIINTFAISCRHPWTTRKKRREHICFRYEMVWTHYIWDTICLMSLNTETSL